MQPNLLELDIRSDVYALGVIAYEALTGRLPNDTNRKALHEVVQAIQEAGPAPLSSINRIYRGDVETIVAKALENDKARRYASAADLAADIRRYLADQPIAARPPSTSYQLQKFARHHRALVAGAAAVFLVLRADVVASTWQAVRAPGGRLAVARRDRASAAAESARQQRDRALEAEKLAEKERNAALTQQPRADSEAASAKAAATSCRTTWLRPAQPTNPGQPPSPIPTW